MPPAAVQSQSSYPRSQNMMYRLWRHYVLAAQALCISQTETFYRDLNESDPEGDENITVRCFQAAVPERSAGPRRRSHSARRSESRIKTTKKHCGLRSKSKSLSLRQKISETISEIFLSKPQGLAYHHNFRCVYHQGACSLHIITAAPCIKQSLRFDDIQHFVLMIYKLSLDDIHASA